MNRNCHGSYISSSEEYRCLYDGVFVKMKEPKGECPQCKRQISCARIIEDSETKIETKKITITQVKLGDLGWVEKSREETLL